MPPQPWKDPKSPALAIVARGDQIEVVSPTEYRVRSQSRSDVIYTVSIVRGRFTCGCEFHASTGIACVHILACRLLSGFKEKKVSLSESVPPCEKCQSALTVRVGVRRNKSGGVHRYLCRACGTYFCGKEGYLKRRSDPELIAKSLDLYFRGVSLRNVAAHLEQAYGLTVSAMTVYRWIVHFSRLASEWMDRQDAKVSEKWHADERVLNVDGQRRYLWNVMDGETRYAISAFVSHDRSTLETLEPFARAKQATSVRPTEIRTDGMTAYPWAIRHEFGPGVHRRVPSIRAPESNNRIERMHGEQKCRTKTMRAYDNDRGAESLSQGYRVHYNLVKEHMTLGKTPGEAAGIESFPGFKWRGIIEKGVELEAERKRNLPPPPEPERIPPTDAPQAEVEFIVGEDGEGW